MRGIHDHQSLCYSSVSSQVSKRSISSYSLLEAIYLEICVVNKDFEILATTSYPFERDNDMTAILNSDNIILNPAFQESIAEDSVIYYLESLIPISKARRGEKHCLHNQNKKQ